MFFEHEHEDEDECMTNEEFDESLDLFCGAFSERDKKRYEDALSFFITEKKLEDEDKSFFTKIRSIQGVRTCDRAEVNITFLRNIQFVGVQQIYFATALLSADRLFITSDENGDLSLSMKLFGSDYSEDEEG